MKIVLDTNVLLVSLSDRSHAHWIFELFLNEAFTIFVTNEILLEYEEIIGREMGIRAAQSFMQILENAPNLVRIYTWFRWNLITADPDDNKFVDCAIACGATYLVSEDNHFQKLKKMSFLHFEVLKIAEFKEIMGV
jgi:uncharacterized protein